MDLKLFFEILNGKYDRIPKDKLNMVRIFLSSTFSDTHVERDYLIANIYPKLTDYCKKQYNLEFQVLDMRWGIASDVTNTHMATSICLNEIDICQNLSIGPNFISFLSHRYGSRGLPTKILESEYNLLSEELTKQTNIDKSFHYEFKPHENGLVNNIRIENMFLECYELDSNSEPSRYRLKFLDRLFPGINQKTPEFNALWGYLESKLGNLIRDLVSVCREKELLSQTEYERYFVSVTEKEIFNGILKAKNRNNNVLYFEREIEGLEENVRANPVLCGKFIDLTNDKNVDQSAKHLLDRLKKEKIKSCMSSCNTHKFKVKWDKEVGISLETHREYVEEFGDIFYKKVKELIDRNCQVKNLHSEKLSEMDEILIREVLDHARFCKDKVSQFHGRKELLNELKSYVLDSNQSPFIIYGESGCGKTAVLAKLADEVEKFVPDPENYVTILRFLGTTPATCTIYSVFGSIVYQLIRVFNYRKDLYDVFKLLKTKAQLKEFLINFLLDISQKFPHKKILIILDSIDQLQRADYDLDWVLPVFPHNIKMFYSSIPVLNGVKLVEHFKKTTFLEGSIREAEITSLDIHLAMDIIRDWLTKAKRSISSAQWQVLTDMFESATLYPLYVKLVFDIVSKWTSFTVPSVEFKNCKNIDSCIKFLFTCFEKDHGKLLFSRAIIYMSSFANGISESEIESILSLDDDVLYDIFEFHAPPIRKLPVALWSRIKYDLRGYMVEKEVDETRVIYWYHRRFIEVAESFYINKLDKEIFMNVVDFFNETWKYKPKPYKYNEFIKKKKKLQGDGGLEECRDSSIQPTVYTDKEGNVRYNTRKINELPEFIARLKPNVSYPLACELIFFNHTFFMGLYRYKTANEIANLLEKFSSGSSYNLVEDAQNAFSNLKMLQLLFLACGFTMSECPSSASGQLVERLLIFYGHFKYITSFIDQYDQEAMNTCSLIVPYQILPTPASDVLFTFDKHVKPIWKSVIGGDNDAFLFTISDKLMLFNMQKVADSGEIKIEGLHDAAIKSLIVYWDELPDETCTLKEIDGGFITASSSCLWSYSYQDQLHFKKDFASMQIASVRLISEEHVCVSFEGMSYVDVYNLFSGDLAERRQLKDKVKFMVVSGEDADKKVLKRAYLNNLILVIAFEMGSISVFKVKLDNKVIELSIAVELPDLSFNCTALRWNSKNTEEEILISTEDGSVLRLVPNTEESSVWGVCLKSPADSKQVGLRSIDDFRDDQFIGVGLNGHVYFGNRQLCEIKGSFQHAILISSINGLVKVAAFSKGTIHYYLINTNVDEQGYYQLLKLSEVDIHFDEVTYLFQKDHMVLTTSMDTTLKVFITNSDIDKSELKFDRSESEITKLSLLGSTSAITQGKSSNHLNLWNLSNGTVYSRIQIPAEQTIENHIVKCKNVFIFSSNQTSPELLFISGFTSKSSSSKKVDRKFSLTLIRKNQQTKILRVHDDNSSFDLVILNKSSNKSIIEIYKLKFSSLALHEDGHILEPDSLVDLSKHVTTINLSDNLATITSKSNLIVLCIEFQLVLIDIATSQVLLKHSVNNETNSLKYFLSPTNLTSSSFVQLEPIAHSDCLIGLDNLQNLNFISYQANSNRIKIFNNDWLMAESFRINEHILVAYDKADKQLIGFDFANTLKEKEEPFKNILFKLSLKKNLYVLNHYGLSSDCKNLFTIEENKKMNFYRLRDVKLTGEMILYSSVGKVVCSDRFVCLTSEDRRVISYMICDPEDPKSKMRIKKLASRKCTVNKELGNTIQKIIKKTTNLLNNSSDDEGDDDLMVEIFGAEDRLGGGNLSGEEKILHQDNVKKIKERIEKIKAVKLEKFILEKDIWSDNWQVDLLKKNNLFGQHEMNLIERREKIKEDLETGDKGNVEEIETLKSLLARNNSRPRTGIVFRNVGRTIITENNLANESKACCIQ